MITWSQSPRATEALSSDCRCKSTIFALVSSASLDVHQLQRIQGKSILNPNTFSLHALKVVALFNLGYVEEAASLGFSIYETRDRHPKSVLISYRSHKSLML